ncbi:MAG: zinc-ribbon domain-containing protein [Lachnospiraceae bacterium]|nr:zinc-ribbon domain-containing protein [Lachnospiraceae bacterium]
MYCSTCGTKLADGALFCSNCGTKVVVEPVEEVKAEAVETAAEVKEEVVQTVEEKKEEVAEAVAEVKEEVAAPVAEVIEEVKAEEPAPAPVVEEPAPTPEPVVEEPVAAPVVEEPAPAPTPVVEEPAPAPVPAPAPAAEPAPAPAAPKAEAKEKKKKEKADKPKKKGKGCLIAVIVIIIIIVLLVLLLGIGALIAFFVFKDKLPGTTTNTNDYTNASDYYGDYIGTSQVVNTYGSQELYDYLKDNGVSIDIADLYTDNSYDDFAISIYEDSDTTPAAWDLIVDMGEYLGYQRFNNKTFITYSDYAKGKYAGGDLLPSEWGTYDISVTDKDMNGYLSDSFFGFEDKSGTYTINMDGTCDGNYIYGTMTISFKYGDMETPYTEEIEFTAYKQ